MGVSQWAEEGPANGDVTIGGPQRIVVRVHRGSNARLVTTKRPATSRRTQWAVAVVALVGAACGARTPLDPGEPSGAGTNGTLAWIDATPCHATLFDAGDVFAWITLPPAARPVQITCGDEHCCALLADRTVRCWGNVGGGRFGSGGEARLIEGLCNVEQISAGAGRTCARHVDGTVRCSGQSSVGGLPPYDRPIPIAGLTGIRDVSVGSFAICVVDRRGQVLCWGRLGSLATDPTHFATVPTVIEGLPPAERVSTGGGHACALARDHSVWCWGANQHNELGSGDRRDRVAPIRVRLESDAVAVAANWARTLVAHRDGRVSCWGDFCSGWSAPTMPVPPSVQSGIADIAQVGGSPFHICARQRSGAVLCWGSNFGARLGLGEGVTWAPMPERVPGLDGVVDLAVGYSASCALRTDGRILCWGSNGRGQLGVSHTDLDGGFVLWTPSLPVRL